MQELKVLLLTAVMAHAQINAYTPKAYTPKAYTPDALDDPTPPSDHGEFSVEANHGSHTSPNTVKSLLKRHNGDRHDRLDIKTKLDKPKLQPRYKDHRYNQPEPSQWSKEYLADLWINSDRENIAPGADLAKEMLQPTTGSRQDGSDIRIFSEMIKPQLRRNEGNRFDYMDNSSENRHIHGFEKMT